MTEPLDTDFKTPNTQMVGSQGNRVVVALPAGMMTPAEAVLHAGWLVAVAQVLDPNLDFDDVLVRIRNT